MGQRVGIGCGTILRTDASRVIDLTWKPRVGGLYPEREATTGPAEKQRTKCHD